MEIKYFGRWTSQKSYTSLSRQVSKITADFQLERPSVIVELKSDPELTFRQLQSMEEPLNHWKKQGGATASWEKGKLSEKGVFRNTQDECFGQRMLIALCEL